MVYVTQLKRFLPLALEAKKLVEEFRKEEIPSQWAGLPPEKLLQESFIEQLDALQSLDQLALLTAAKEHLPGVIISILELLGKVNNIPFNQLHNLAEDCADRYYTKVIQTLTRLMKNSFHNRQLVLVNTARVLKFLESYAASQTKLWKVLSKYHNLPDHFHDLKTTLQAEFDLLKKATSKNIQNIQEVVHSQQAYMTVLSGHINTLYTKLAHLDKQVQIHCLHPHPQSDVIQLNIPDYNPDIDGEFDPQLMYNHQMQNPLKKRSQQIPPNQKITILFPQLPIGLSISPQKFYQILTAQNMTTLNNHKQNIPVITAPNWKTSQN